MHLIRVMSGYELQFVLNLLKWLFRVIMTPSAGSDVKLTMWTKTIDTDVTQNEMFLSPAWTFGTSDGGKIDCRRAPLFDLSTAIRVF
jgi:hypothetical protein